jgi:hypothetical protein
MSVEAVKLGRDLDVSIVAATETNGLAVPAGLVEVLAELVDYANAGGLLIDWGSLKVGVESNADEGPLAPLRIRARVLAEKPNADAIVEGLTAIARGLHERDRDGRRPL